MSGQEIDADTVRAWQVAGVDFTLVDTLPPSAFQKGHLPGAIHIMSDNILGQAAQVLPDKAAPVVVYCASERCRRAGLSAARLESLGYTDVYHFAGGKRAWQEAGYPFA